MARQTQAAIEDAADALVSTTSRSSVIRGLAATVYYAVAKRLPHSKGRHDATGTERFPQLVESPATLDRMRHSPA